MWVAVRLILTQPSPCTDSDNFELRLLYNY